MDTDPLFMGPVSSCGGDSCALEMEMEKDSGKTTFNSPSGGACLICQSSMFNVTSTPESESKSSRLSNQLQVYFLLKHVLQLPSELLENYLKNCPNPEDWVKVCPSCDNNYIEKCDKIFLELEELRRKFRVAKLEVVEAIRRFAKVKGEFQTEADKEMKLILDISKDTRQFVVNYNYDSFEPATFTTGDAIAREKLTEYQARELRNAETSIFPGQSSPVASDTFNDNDDLQAICQELDILDDEVKLEPASPLPPNYMPEHPDSDSEYTENTTSMDWDPNDIEFSPENEDLKPDFSTKSKQKRKKTVYPKKSQAKYPCDRCPSFFGTWTSHREHQIQAHNDPNLFECDRCFQKHKTFKQLTSHMNDLHGVTQLKIIPCPQCQEKFPSNLDANLHLLHVHTKKSKRQQGMKCSKCPETFQNKYKYFNHQAVDHSVKKYQKFPCPVKSCNLSFYTRKIRESHQITAHKPDDTNVSKSKKYQCPECNHLFKNYGTYQTHLGNVHGLNLQRLGSHCKVIGCNKRFYSRDLLFKHQRSVHQAEKQIECKICGKILLNNLTLKSHIKNLHETKGVKNFACELCPAAYKTKSRLAEHTKRVHDDANNDIIKMFPCKECDFVSKSESGLKSHVDRKHWKKFEEKIVCELCGKVIVRCYKNEHMARIHQVFAPGFLLRKQWECTVEGCGGKFESKARLQLHVASVHEKLKPFQCEQCGNNFASRNGLKRHMKAIHSENKVTRPFKCELCGDGFAVKEYLWCHMKTHKNDKKVVASSIDEAGS